MRRFFIILTVLGIPFIMNAQEGTKEKKEKDTPTNIIAPPPPKADNGEEKKFGVTWSGLVKSDFFWDSRQTVAAREGHFLLYPAGESLSQDNLDLNARPNLNFLAVQTRLKATISGPDAFGAKTSGAIEGAFFGHSDPDVNGFRLRHAFAKLNWPKLELLFGQYWHPMFVTSCFPGVVSFNTGVPFQPFSRNPQFRFTYKIIDQLSVIGVAYSQRDFSSTGPAGTSSVYLRNSGIPAGHLQLMFSTESITAGAGGDFKRLTPRLVTNGSNGNYVAEEYVDSYSGFAYAKYSNDMITFKVEGVYGQNMTDLLMLGGYVQDEITSTYYDYRTWKPTQTASGWAEIHTNTDKFALAGGNLNFGVFGGYTKNMGTLDIIDTYSTSPLFYMRGSNIDYVYRISPRIVYGSGKMKLQLECEYTTAAYGTGVDAHMAVQNSEEITNIRGLFSMTYTF